MNKISLQSLGILWVVAALVISMLPQLVSMPVHLVAITLAPVGWRLLAEFRDWKPISVFFRLVATLFAIAALISTYGGLMGRRAAVSMLVIMLALKLLETFRVRDARIVASLSLFLCGTQFLFSQGLVMVLYSVACLLSSLIALTYLQRREAYDSVGMTPETDRGLFSQLGFGIRLMALAFPIGLAIFLFFPRWGSPLWGVPEDALDARSGLSDSMSPGSIQSLFMDDSPAFRVQFEGNIPRHSEMYWRGPVFGNFDGRRWQANYMDINLPAVNKPDPNNAAFRYEVQMESTEQRWLFALNYPALVPRNAKLTVDYQLLSRHPLTQLRSYVMASDPDFIDTPELKTTLRLAALDLPPDFNPKAMEMMTRWRSETSNDADLVRRTLQYFNQQEFHYTLNPALLSRHTVDEFLFETREGFCEHYASAFTVMMRMAGIPARVVTGYQGGWYNDIGAYVLVRQSDAHAWSEVWLAGSGWTRIDPTASVAPERVEQGAMDSLAGRRHLFDYEWLRKTRNTFDLFQRGWNNWVVAFNATSQSRLFSAFGWEFISSAKLVVIMITASFLLGAAIFLLAPILLKFRSAKNLDPSLQQWKIFNRKLVKAGLKPYPSMGPLELAAYAGDQMKYNNDSIKRIAELYMLCRYSPDNDRLAELAGLIRRFKPRQQRRESVLVVY